MVEQRSLTPRMEVQIFQGQPRKLFSSGVMAAQEFLVLLVEVQILAGKPTL